jgi:hypothetical protein
MSSSATAFPVGALSAPPADTARCFLATAAPSVSPPEASFFVGVLRVVVVEVTDLEGAEDVALDLLIFEERSLRAV